MVMGNVYVDIRVENKASVALRQTSRRMQWKFLWVFPRKGRFTEGTSMLFKRYRSFGGALA